MPNEIHIKVKRQDSPNGASYWQDFKIPYRSEHTVITALMEIQRNPKTVDGQSVSAPVWEASCLEEVCGSCTVVINGKPRQACSTLVDNLLAEQEFITLEPLSKFPLIRDLRVDRTKMFDALRRVQGWIPIDKAVDTGERGPRIAPEDWEERYLFSRCMTCGCCMEVCPQYHEDSEFIGPAPLGQTYYFNSHPLGDFNKEDRLHAIMGEGGIADCGNAQNCVEVCPKEISLTKAIASLGRQTTVQWFKDLFSK